MGVAQGAEERRTTEGARTVLDVPLEQLVRKFVFVGRNILLNALVVRISLWRVDSFFVGQSDQACEVSVSLREVECGIFMA